MFLAVHDAVEELVAAHVEVERVVSAHDGVEAAHDAIEHGVATKAVVF